MFSVDQQKLQNTWETLFKNPFHDYPIKNEIGSSNNTVDLPLDNLLNPRHFIRYCDCPAINKNSQHAIWKMFVSGFKTFKPKQFSDILNNV